ncbi:DNA-binding protein [Rhodobacter sp. CZR27]|uniref:DNA-binding protein n=1 Tax=Rhodobacter sp. CZR27 TaxID=2033869 RepID=UPI000BBED458
MPARPAPTVEDVLATGLALRAEGEEPTQAKLFRRLGRTGHPATAWKIWQEHGAKLLPTDAPAEVPDRRRWRRLGSSSGPRSRRCWTWRGARR